MTDAANVDKHIKSVRTPSAPRLLSPAAGNAKILLRWTASSDNGGSSIINYRLYRGTAAHKEKVLTTVGNVLTYSDASVSSGATYYYTVSPINSIGEGAQSNEVSATPPAAPSAPTLYSIVPGNTQVAIAWTAPASGGSSTISNYNIYRGTNSGGEVLLTTIGNVLTFIDTSTTNGRTYYYEVSAINTVGEGALSNELCAMPSGPPTVPQNVQASPGNAFVNVTWQPPSGDGGSSVTGYQVWRGPSSGVETFWTDASLINWFNDTGLTNGKTYYYTIRAENSLGLGLCSNEASATPSQTATAPSAPQGLSATPDEAQVTLAWSPPSNNGSSAITGYKIYRGDASGTETMLALLGNVHSYGDTSLANGKTYYYTVSAINAIGESPMSTEVNATPATVPSAPNMISATPGDVQVVLVWTAPSSGLGNPITNYRVYRGTTAGGETLLATLGNVLTFADSGLLDGQIYYYRVSALNPIGEGALSNELSAMPVNTPSAPQNLRVAPHNSSIALTWQAPNSNGGSAVIKYEVWRGASSSEETHLADANPSLSFNDTGLTNGQTYYYFVKARNAQGLGPNSNEVSATPSGTVIAPSEPQTLTASSGNGQIVLSWSAPSSNGGAEITNYNLYSGTTSGGETLLLTLGKVLTYTCSGLTNGQIYYFRVSAVNPAGEGSQSNEVSAIPATAPSAPAISSAVPGNGQIVLTWTAPVTNGGSSVAGYRVYRGTSSCGETLQATIGAMLTYVDTRLTNGQTYYYKVSAVNSIGEGLLSNEASAIPATTPSNPQNLSA
ncbi:MAG: fibronectin type III domain-containing protein, partial [Methanomassiliicoccales archaeon]